ncbi:MAG: SDR family oxidoreductase [Clostridia bacterium]|nr:SDR family oxidoreductase [Clostridia bacterium]
MKALVTGASSGIGYNMSKYLSQLGYDLIVVARRSDCLENLKKECSTKVEIIVLDLSIKDNVYQLYSRVKNQNIDMVINNAGFGVFGKFDHTELSRDLSMINLNIVSLHILTKLFLKDMKKRNSGVILNVGSIAGFTPGPLMSTYYATKSYVVRLTQSIYYELKKEKSKVKISVLCPGPVDTQFNDALGISFRLPPLSSDYVAKYAINKCLKGKVVIIPGISAKIVRLFSKIIPDIVIMKVNYIIQLSKKRSC